MLSQNADMQLVNADSQCHLLVQLPIAKVRFVAVSATIPNIQDIASWLQVPPAGLKAFGEEVRPVKIRTVVKGYAPTKTDFLFERRLNDYIFSVVAENSKSKPALVFCRSAHPPAAVLVHAIVITLEPVTSLVVLVEPHVGF